MRDLITGIVGAALSGFYLSQLETIRIFAGASANVNARTVPDLWGKALLILSVILIIRSIINIMRAKKQEAPKPAAEGKKKGILSTPEVIYTFALLIVYAAVMEEVGFILSSMIYLFLQIIVLTPLHKRCKKVYITAAILAVVCSTLFYYLFTNYLMVLLPAGLLDF